MKELLNRETRLQILVLGNKLKSVQIERDANKKEYDRLSVNKNEKEQGDKVWLSQQMDKLKGEIKGLEYAINLLRNIDSPFEKYVSCDKTIPNYYTKRT